MEPILNKHEIAELLRALREGAIPADSKSEQQQEKFLSCQPIDLFNLVVRQPEEIRFPNFDLILDNFSKNYSVSLTNDLQRTFSITRTGLESAEFQEFIHKMSTPGAIGILNLPPLKQGVLVIFDPNLSYSLVEIMLGASADLSSTPPARSLTTLELSILKPLLSLSCGSIDRAFKPLLDIASTLRKVESNPRFVSVTEPDAEVLVSAFQVEIGEISGELTLVFPVATLSPVREKLKGLLNLHEMALGTWPQIIENAVQELPTTITAQSGMVTLTVDQILKLKKGDIIDIDYDPNSPLKILVGNKLKFFAKPGVHHGKKAISLTGVYNQGI